MPMASRGVARPTVRLGMVFAVLALVTMVQTASSVSLDTRMDPKWTNILLDTSKPKVTLMTPTIESRCKFFGQSILRNLQRSTYGGELELVLADWQRKRCTLISS